MKRVYVAGPYTAPRTWQVVQNIRAAEAVALELWRLGFAVFCPHMNAALLTGAPGIPNNIWLKGDLAWLEVSEALVVLPGFSGSPGTRAEIVRARELNIPIFYWRDVLRVGDACKCLIKFRDRQGE